MNTIAGAADFRHRPACTPVVEHPVGLELLVEHLDLSQAWQKHEHCTWTQKPKGYTNL